ncbi:helix-turn-helix domain-containing protein [Streptomyces sp. NPDC059161]|uniref:helix-turn-helix domain-containing protein n=1 Tax=Streptomyces sp. NPDC059161 TaxID=3346749 RepID=UPI0036C757DB
MSAVALPQIALPATPVAVSETCHCMRRPLANAQQIAEYCGVPLKTVYRWSSRGGGGPRLMKVGRHLKARWSDLDAYLDSCSIGARQ